LLIVGSALAITVAAGVFIATMVARGSSAAPAALLPPLMLQRRQTSASAVKLAAAGMLPAQPLPHCQHGHHAASRCAATTLVDTAAMLLAAALPPHGHNHHAAVAALPPLRCHRSAATTATLPTPPPDYPLPPSCHQPAAATLPPSTKMFVARHIKNIVVPLPTTTTPYKIFIMSDEDGEHRRCAAVCHRRADDTLLPPHCH
jgi:hypothetical protein